jgi:hypothetical protein
MTEVYGSPYANNISKMRNSEVVGLAKNRFTDAETQLAISKHWYRLGKEYLAANSNLTQEAARVLWDHRGYVLKATMLAAGNIELTEQEYIDTYRKYFKNNSRSIWRMQQAFLARPYWASNNGESKTPGKLLEEIYADLPEEETVRTYTLQRFVDHPNCSLDLALRIGTMKTPDNQQRYYSDSFERLRQKAMLKVAEITKRSGAHSR